MAFAPCYSRAGYGGPGGPSGPTGAAGTTGPMGVAGFAGSNYTRTYEPKDMMTQMAWWLVMQITHQSSNYVISKNTIKDVPAVRRLIKEKYIILKNKKPISGAVSLSPGQSPTLNFYEYTITESGMNFIEFCKI